MNFKKIFNFFLMTLMLVNTLAESDMDALGNDFKLDPGAQKAYQAMHPQKVTERGLFMDLRLIESEKAKILLSLGAVGLLIAFDQQIMDGIQDNRNDLSTHLADLGDFVGSRRFIPGLIVGTLGVGLVFKDDKLKRTAYRTLKAAVISGLVTETLKALTHRKRPNKGEGPYVFEGAGWSSDNTSFPSGHSTGAWAVATVFATEYKDTKWVPWVAYSLATITSWSRVYDEKHWGSDVVLGALIGYVTGKLFTNSLFQKKGIVIIPEVGERIGVSVHMPIGKKPTPKKPELLFD